MLKYDVIVSESNKVFQQYNMPLTLRQLFYRLVAKLIFPNTMNNYKALSKMLVKARERGDVDDSWIEDRTRQTIGGDWGYEDSDDFIQDQIDDLKKSWERFTMKMWEDQPHIVEVWVEKDALSRVVSEIARGFRTRTCPSKGYSSYTYLKDAAERIDDAGKPVVVLYFGDYDPSGLDIVRDLEERLDRYRTEGTELTVKRIALTLDQIREHNLPPMPAKTSDPRLAKFIADTGGTDAVELDALEPDVLQDLVKKAINQHINVETWNKRRELIEKKKEELRERLAKLKIIWEEEDKEKMKED